jgi:hypothetical protein
VAGRPKGGDLSVGDKTYFGSIALAVLRRPSISRVSLAVAASGGAHIKTVVLMTPEEMDQAAKKNVGYRPPGK